MNARPDHMTMPNRNYHRVAAGLPPQSAKLDGRAVFTNAYAFLPANTMTDIVASFLPHWEKTRLWILARPLSGFAETFSQYIMEVEGGGGSDRPEEDVEAQSVLFVTVGEIVVTVEGESHAMGEGGYAYIPAGVKWSLVNKSEADAQFHWIRKRYEIVDGIDRPEPIFLSEQSIEPTSMPDTQDRWATTRFLDPTDTRYDMHATIVTFQPGGLIPFPETHVMEHGLYVLEGTADYLLNQDWIEVGPGDFMWLRAFCPQACVAKGDGPFRYLLYKDVNRHAKLGTFVR